MIKATAVRGGRDWKYRRYGSWASSRSRKIPPRSDWSRDATTTSLLSMTEKWSFEPMATVFTVGSKPGIPDVSGDGPEEQAHVSAAASAKLSVAVVPRGRVRLLLVRWSVIEGVARSKT